MAAAVQRIIGAGYGLVTVELPGAAGGSGHIIPASDTRSTAAATSTSPSEAVLCVGLAAPREVKARTYRLPLYNPAVKKPLFVMAALDYLRKELLSGS
jgi:hypothetical protein